MIPKVGDKIIVTALPSYIQELIPSLPKIAEVIRIDPYPYIVVDIGGIKYELYEDDGYETTTEEGRT